MNINEDSNKDYSDLEQDQESEIIDMEAEKIKLNKKKIHSSINKYKNNINNKNWLFIIIIIIIIILFFISFFINFIKKNKVNKSFYNENFNIFNEINNNKDNQDNKLIKNDSNEYKGNEKIATNNITINNTKIDNNKKITIVFVYSTLFANGIARFITLTANYLIETGKYDIYLITGKPFSKDYKFNNKIKRVFAHNNATLIKNFTKYVNVDFFILQNVLGKGSVDFFRSVGKKVISIFHGVYMSAMFHGQVSSYRNWHEFDLFDSFIFISYDDYFFYNKLGFKNEIFIPNLYTFEPSKTKSSNLTNHNIMMLGRAADTVKGFIYSVKTMPYIIKEVPDAILYIFSSNYHIDFLKKLAVKLNVSKNIIFNYFIENITEVFWNSSVFMYTSLSEAFPMAMNEAKAHGLPIVAFDVPYSIPYQSGVINVDMLDCEALANETIKLLKNYEYRKKMGELAKLSLNQFSNNETIELWGKLFNSLLEGENAYRKLQKEIETKYYNEEKSRAHMEKHYQDLLRYDKNFTCHSINNFTDINYIKNIEACPNSTNSSNSTKIMNKTNILNSTDSIIESKISINNSDSKK